MKPGNLHIARCQIQRYDREMRMYKNARLSTGRFFVALRRNLSIFSHCVNGVCPAVGGRAEKGV